MSKIWVIEEKGGRRKRGEREEKGLWWATELERWPRKVRSTKWTARKGALFYREEEEEEQVKAAGVHYSVILSSTAVGKVFFSVLESGAPISAVVVVFKAAFLSRMQKSCTRQRCTSAAPHVWERFDKLAFHYPAFLMLYDIIHQYVHLYQMKN